MAKGKKQKSKSNSDSESNLMKDMSEAMPEQTEAVGQSDESRPEDEDSSAKNPNVVEESSKELIDNSDVFEQKEGEPTSIKSESTSEEPKVAATAGDELKSSITKDSESDEFKTKGTKSNTSPSSAIETKDVNEDSQSERSEIPVEKKETKSTKKKSVGFAPPPEEDLKEHHEDLKKKEEQKRKSNPFQRMPPELSYLQKKPEPPKPLNAFTPHPSTPRRGVLKELGDLRNMPIKEISLQNKETELNFNYPTIHLPIQSHHILVDVKFGSLNSFDLAKINNYILNLSNTKVGLGYEFSGKVIEVGAGYQSEFAVGDNVFGCINSIDRKGALSSSLIVNPTKDVLISVDDNVLEKVENLNIELSFRNVTEDGNFEINSTSSSSLNSDVEGTKEPTNLRNKLGDLTIDEQLPPLAKLSTFSVLYCRAKQALDHSNAVFEKTGKANILINGADTNMGFTIIQLLNSSVYSTILNEMNLILTIKESSFDKMTKLVNYFTKGKYFDPSRKKRIHLVTFDMENEDLILPGEKVPLNYKKPDLFASDVLNALFGDSEESINKNNVVNHKLDLIIDIVGSKKYLQTLSIRYSKLETLSLPYLSKFSADTTLSQVLNSRTKEPFILKILKPKSYNSCFVSCCKFNLSFPSYNIDELFDYSGSNISLNPWSMKWSSNLANSLSSYYYFEELSLRVKKAWILEGLNLLLEDELKFRIDDFIDWRNNFKKYIKLLKKDDGKVVFKIEDF
ncbi:uncharacterized protein AC631_03082 [Debaryomyces fabryi]|uniref:Alcohol dehydrogenase-like N-terminal domain-containing protein n=1 Tax=Debaryomyces fabryi TaxID=58627 RepID=A0A0V1PYJ8_9ASCO|nr:uncharacterized protein AC631_03082 [Debaryomyces fabryi]KSA01141.1 hypothetical protein AC631_03082 [Debaryomyces fabryi]CUM46371.1 unnamed protein product [Debaryomyces fabryi]